MLARPHDDPLPVLAPRDHTAGERREQSRADDRRLAAAGRPDDAEQRGADEPRDELRDEPLAAEEVRRVRLLERRQALERADDPVAVLAAGLGPLVGGLELDDAARELVLEGPQLGAAGRNAPRRPLARPLAGGVVYAARHAAARAQEPFERHAVAGGLLGRVQSRDRADPLGPELPQVEHAVRLERLDRLRMRRGREDERVRPRQAAQRGQHSIACPVRVVEDEEHRIRRRGGAVDSIEALLGGAEAGRVDHGRAVAVGGHRHLGRQPRLAHAPRAGQDEPPAGAGAGLVPAREQPLELVVSPGDRRRCGRFQRVREIGRPRALQRRVVAQDRLVERAQLRPGLDADLVRELAPCRPIGVERLGLAPAAVEGDHQLPREPLARRMVGDQPPELRNQLGVPARRGVSLHAGLERRQPLLLQLRDLGLRERLEREVGQRRAAPQRRRLAQTGRRLLGTAGREQAAPLFDEPLEPVGVELSRPDAELVARCGRDQDVGVVPKRLAQARDVHLHGLHGAGRRVLAPQRLRDPLCAHRLVGAQQQNGEDGARLPASQGDDAVIAVDLQGTKDPEVHRPE